MQDDRHRNRIPLPATHLDGRLDDVAEHVTWHGGSSSLQTVGSYKRRKQGGARAPIIASRKRTSQRDSTRLATGSRRLDQNFPSGLSLRRDAHAVERPSYEEKGNDEEDGGDGLADTRARIARELDGQLDGQQPEQCRELNNR